MLSKERYTILCNLDYKYLAYFGKKIREFSYDNDDNVIIRNNR